MAYVLPVLMLLIGLAVGGAAVWLVLRARIDHAVERVKGEAESVRATLAERVQSREQALNEAKTALHDRDARLHQQQAANSDLERKLVQYHHTLQSERTQHKEKVALLDEARTKLADAFKALASEALKSNNQSFLELANTKMEKFQETAKGDLEKRQQAINDLVKPVKESLEKVDGKIQELEKARVGAYSGLTEQVKSLLEMQKDLRSETGNLVKALRTPTVRGRWGEIQLKRVVEMAGMQDHCDFYEQKTADSEDGKQRPDMLVRLPAAKNIVVDAKAPLWGYLEAVEASDDDTRKAKFLDHARQLRGHMASLGKKSYFEQFSPAPEFVVLFLPGESFFSAALAHDPTLIEFGVEQNVIVASPTTLIALLRAVAYGWRQEQIAQNAKEISELGRELYKRCSILGGHMAELGSSLQRAVEFYNKAVGSLESRVLVTARRFNELGAAGQGIEIEELGQLDVVSRSVQAPELLELAAAVDQDGDGKVVSKPR